MFAGKKSAQIREILISESAWEEMTCLFAPSLDANSLRRQIGKQAQAINHIDKSAQLRERIGHTKWELVGGIFVGVFIGYIMHLIVNHHI